jgi:pimeloyl-ACP methyl ester carboxylesterase
MQTAGSALSEGFNMHDTLDKFTSAALQPGAEIPADQLDTPVITNTKVAALSLPLRLFAGSMRQLDKLAPDAVTRLMLHHFVHPRRPSSADYSRLLPAGARPLSLQHRGTELRGWCWQPCAQEAVHRPTVVLVHGWEDHTGAMLPMVTPLLARGYRVLALDAPGHGLSQRTHTDLHDYGQALLQLLRMENSVYGIVAHSWGAAATSLLLARQPELQPARLALIAPMQGIRQHLSIFAGIAGMCELRQQRLARLLLQRLPVPIEQLCALQAVSSLQIPGLLVHDIRDPLIPHNTASAIAQHWSAAQLMNTRDLGHRRILANPAVHERLVRFLEE